MHHVFIQQVFFFSHFTAYLSLVWSTILDKTKLTGWLHKVYGISDRFMSAQNDVICYPLKQQTLNYVTLKDIPAKLLWFHFKNYVKSTCRHKELVSRVGKHLQMQITELVLRKNTKRRETRGLFYHFVLTRWHIHSFAIRAKLIGRRTRDSQICSRHNCDLVYYLPVEEGTLIMLSDKRKTKTQMLVFTYLTSPVVGEVFRSFTLVNVLIHTVKILCYK